MKVIRGKSKNKMEQQTKEIIWNFVNAGLAGLLVTIGACTDGTITYNGILAAILAGIIVAVTKFKTYWETQEGEYSRKNTAFTFI